jgi:hypothetical protein
VVTRASCTLYTACAAGKKDHAFHPCGRMKCVLCGELARTFVCAYDGGVEVSRKPRNKRCENCALGCTNANTTLRPSNTCVIFAPCVRKTLYDRDLLVTMQVTYKYSREYMHAGTADCIYGRKGKVVPGIVSLCILTWRSSGSAREVSNNSVGSSERRRAFAQMYVFPSSSFAHECTWS